MGSFVIRVIKQRKLHMHSSVDNALGRHVLWSRIQSPVRVRSLSAKELFTMNSMHVINRQIKLIYPGRKKRVRRCPLQSGIVADTLINSVNVISRAGMGRS